MLRKLICATSALALVMCVGVTAQAAAISINLGNGLGSSDVAGYVPLANWNNISDLNNTGVALNDDSGAVSGVTIDYSLGGGGQNTPDSLSATNNTLYSQGVRSFVQNNDTNRSTSMLRLNNLNTFFPGGYTIYFYTGEPSEFTPATGPAIIESASGTTLGAYNGHSIAPPAGTSYGLSLTEGQKFTGAGDSSSFVLGSNYVAIDHTGGNAETSPVFTLWSTPTLSGNAYGGETWVGLQIVGNAVPEPSSIALAGIGLVGLVGFGLRRRSRKNA